MESGNWKKCLYQFLLNYRATPHSMTGFAPAQLLFNCEIRTKLPQTITSKNDQTLREKDKQAKEKMKQNADKRSQARNANILVGDTVLLRQKKQNKWSTRFDPVPFQVVRRKGCMVTVSRNGRFVTRNISLFKKVSMSSCHETELEDDTDDDLSEKFNDGNDNQVEAPQAHSVPRYPI